MNAKSRIKCVYYAAGRCKMGENCRLSHNLNAIAPRCKFFAQGITVCKYGERCIWRHECASFGMEPCKDFIAGFCRLGTKCQKMHDVPRAAKELEINKGSVPNYLRTEVEIFDSKSAKLWRSKPLGYRTTTLICRLVLSQVGISHSLQRIIDGYLTPDRNRAEYSDFGGHCCNSTFDKTGLKNQFKDGSYIRWSSYCCRRCGGIVGEYRDIFFAIRGGVRNPNREIDGLIYILICRDCLGFGYLDNKPSPACITYEEKGTAGTHRVHPDAKFHWKDGLPVAETTEDMVSFAGLKKFQIFRLDYLLSECSHWFKLSKPDMGTITMTITLNE